MDFWFIGFLFTVAILLAVGVSLLLVGYLGSLPTAFDFGWRWWLPALLIPIGGPIWFAVRHWQEFAKPGKQLIFGLVLLGAAITLLYGAGPHFVDRLAAGVK